MPLSRRDALKALLAGSVGAAAGATIYSAYTTDAVQLTHVTIPLEGLPSSLSGLRIGLLTDVHRSQWVSDEDVRTAVSLLMNERPDLVVLGGDYVTWGDRTYVNPSADAVASLSAPHGVFAVLGNHDDDRDMPAALTARGITVLKDARTSLTIRGETLDLAGLRFWTRRPEEIERVVKGGTGTTIMLAHDPRRIQEAAALNVPLLLSGHTHGGQVVLPVVGAIAAKKFPILAGVAQEGPTTVFVSRGVGTVYVPVRVNCPPEVAVLTLEATSPAR
ncbi:MAG: metallophosphoesterase [Vicinamibacterales bacterium]